jgi:hypothetical protein
LPGTGNRASGSAHTGAEVELLKAAAQQRLTPGQGEFDLDTAAPSGPLPIIASRISCLVAAFERAYRMLGFEQAARRRRTWV